MLPLGAQLSNELNRLPVKFEVCLKFLLQVTRQDIKFNDGDYKSENIKRDIVRYHKQGFDQRY